MNRGVTGFQLGYVLLLIAAFAFRSAPLTALYSVVCVLYVLRNLKRLQEASVADMKLVCLMVVGPSLLVVVSIPRVGLAAGYHYLVAVLAAIAAYAATRDLSSYWRASKWGLLVTQGVIIGYLAVVGTSGFPLENVIPNSSANGITSYVVLFQINYCIVNYVRRGRFAWATQLATLFICVVGFGRGSILASVATLIASFAVSSLPRPGRSRFAGFALAALATFAIVRNSDQILLYADANTKIGAGLGDPSRSTMIADYLNHMTIATAVVGGSYENTAIANDYSDNPHNSFIRAHHIFGLGYLIVIAALPFYVVAGMRATGADRVYVLLMMLILYFRAFTEPILFPTLYDFFFFGMCFAVRGSDRRVPGSETEHPRRHPAFRPTPTLSVSRQ